MDSQPMQLHDKVQKLIEEYSKDKKRLAELEAQLAEKNKDSESSIIQINQMQKELTTLKETNNQLNLEYTALQKKYREMEQNLSSFESFADDLNSKIDELIPQIEKL